MNKTEIVLDNQISQYTRVFDETNPNWSNNPEENMFFLEIAQNMFTDMLRSRGYLFLNEVYDYLGFESSEEGDIIGWNRDNGDGCVYFYIDFVNDHDLSILLDFNVDGIIKK